MSVLGKITRGLYDRLNNTRNFEYFKRFGNSHDVK